MRTLLSVSAYFRAVSFTFLGDLSNPSCTKANSESRVVDWGKRCVRLAMLALAAFGLLETTAAAQTASPGTGTVLVYQGEPGEGLALDSVGNLYLGFDTDIGLYKSTYSNGSYTTAYLSGSGTNWYFGVAVDSNNNLYLADEAATGIWKAVGSGSSYTFTNIIKSPGFSAAGVAVDGYGNVYTNSYSAGSLYKYTLSGGVYTQHVLASGVGTARNMAIDPSGVVYLAVQTGGTHSVGYVITYTPVGSVQTTTTYTAATIYECTDSCAGVAVKNGVVYVGDGTQVIKLTPTGSGSYTQTVASTGYGEIRGMAVDSNGNVLVSDLTTDKITKLTTTLPDFGSVTVGAASTQQSIAFQIGTGGTLGLPLVLTQGVSGQDFTLGTGSTCTGTVTANTSCVVNVVFTPKYPGERYGAVELTNGSGAVIATQFIQGSGSGPEVTSTPGVISTIAGTGIAGNTGNGGAATNAAINGPSGVVVDAAGNVYIADTYAQVVRKITASTGLISTVAGNGTAGYSGDGAAATSAQLNYPNRVVLDGAGNLFIADSVNNRIREVNAATGVITTVAGNGTRGYNGDGIAATSAELAGPYAVAVDGAGNLFIADTLNSRIRRVTVTTGIISTVAGTGTGGYSGDGSAATAAEINAPRSIFVDQLDDLYFADLNNSRVRSVNATSGIISTVAGNGTAGYAGDGGAAVSAELNLPLEAVVDAAGDVYIADAGNNRIRKVTVASGTISTIAGNATACSSAATTGCVDGGSAVLGELYAPQGVTVDGAGNVYIGDLGDSLVREVTATGAGFTFATTPAFSTSSDSPQTETISNIGNATLKFPAPTTGTNPAIAAPFTIGNTSTCPQLSTSSSARTLASGASCTDLLSFTPQSVGVISGTMITTDDNAAGAAVTQSVSLRGTATIASQTINFAALASPIIYTSGINATLSATATSGLPVTFSVISGPATVSGSTVTYTGVGTVVLAADQAGNSDYTAAPEVQQTVVVNDASQTITFTSSAGPYTYGHSPITLAATGGASGNPVTFSYVSGPGALSGSTLTITGAGTIVVAANQAGNGNYNPASQVTQTITVNPAVLGVSIIGNPAKTYDGTTTAALTSANYQLSNLVAGDNFTVTQTTGAYGSATAGPETVTAALSAASFAVASGSLSNYTLPTAASGAGTILQAGQTIAFTSSPGPYTYLQTSTVSLTATGGASGNPVNFVLVSGPGSLSGSTLSILGAGTIVVLANQVGSTNYGPALPVTQNITVNPAPSTITFTPPNSPMLVNSTDVLNANSSSGAAVTFSVISGTANIVGSNIIYTTAGTIVIAANAAGSTNFAAPPTVTQTVVVTAEPTAYLAPTAGVGTTSATQTAYVNIATAGTLGAINVLTKGSPNLDYALVAGGTCSAGTVYTAGQACSVLYTFTPSAAGNRAGGITLVDGSGNALGTSFLGGVGTAPVGVFNSGTQTTFFTVGDGGQNGMTFDGAGDLFYSDLSNGSVFEVPVGTQTPTTIATGLGVATDVAVDGVGNIYYGSNNENVIYELKVGTTTPVVLDTPPNPEYFAVDMAGNLFAAIAGSQVVKEYLVNGTTATFGTGLGHPQAIALDASDNIYLTDRGLNQVLMITPQNVQTVLASGFGFPVGIALDPAGNIYVADLTSNAIDMLAAGTYQQSTVGSGWNGPKPIFMDATGNLYVANTGTGTVVELNRSTASMAFPPTTYNTTSAPQLTAFVNIGNQPLAINAVSASTNFQVDPANACAIGGLAPGATCLIAADFAPTATGALAGALTLTDNSLNQTSFAQVVSLTGAATPAAQTITFSPAGPYTYGQVPVTLSATGGASTNAVTFSVLSGPGSISGSTLTITGAGTIVVAANQSGNDDYSAATQVTQNIAVSPATLGVAFVGNLSKQYDGTSTAALTAANYQLSNLVGTDNFTVSQTAGSYDSASAGPRTVTVNLSPANFASISGNIANYIIPISVSGAGTITQANASVTPNAATKVYGTSDPTFTGVLSGFVASDNVSATYSRIAGNNVGSYSISVTLSPSAVLSNYNVAYNTAALTITPATASVTPNAAAAVYGTPDPAFTGTLSGFIASENVTASYSRAAGTSVGSYTISAALSPTAVLSNYSITYNTAAFTITPASASVTPNAATKVYGTSDPAFSGTLSGFVASDNVTASYSRSAGTGVGSYTISAALSPTAVLSNYNITYNTAAFTITPAILTASIVGTPTKTYNGTTAATLTSANFLLGGVVSGDAIAVNQTVGTYASAKAGAETVTAVLSPSNFSATSGSMSNYTLPVTAMGPGQITQAMPVITWATPAAITYGTALSSTQLNATASVTGTFIYAPAAGTLGAGPHTLTVMFTPTDTTDYSSASATVVLTVNKATPTITWANPAPINYGTVLSGTQLNATASVTGTFTYTPVAGTLLTGGVQTLSVLFTPSDTTDYNTQTKSVTIQVNESTVTMGVSSGTQTYQTWTNFVLGPTWSQNYSTSKVPTGTVTLYNNGTALVTLSLGGNGLAYWTTSPPLNVGVNNLTVYYSGDANYPAGLSAVTTITVLPAQVNFQQSCSNGTMYNSNPWQCTVSISASTTTTPGGVFTYSLDGGAPVNVNVVQGGSAVFTVPGPLAAGTHKLVFNYAAQGNYAAAGPFTSTVTTQQGQSQLQVSPSSYYLQHGTSLTLNGSLTSPNSGAPPGTVTFYDNGTAIGTGTVGANGSVSYTVTSISQGSHSYSAKYAGTANYTAANWGNAGVTAY